MDHRTIFTKTAKGLGEAVGKSRALSRDLRKVLKEIDGSASLQVLADKLALPEGKLHAALAALYDGGYIREFASAEADEAEFELPLTAVDEQQDALTVVTMGAFLREVQRQAHETPVHAMPPEAAVATGETAGPATEPGFAADDLPLAPARQESLRRAVAQAFAKIDAERQAQQEAAERAAQEAEREAREKAQRKSEERARRQAEAQARWEAERRARREAEEQARLRAEEEARRQAAEQARHEAAERARAQAEEQRLREQQEREQQRAAAAQMRRETAERYKREATERAQRAAEEKRRIEEEARARQQAEDDARRAAEEQARREAEERARQEALERQRRAAEEQAQREAELRRQQEAEERARRQAQEEAQRLAEEQARHEAEALARRQAEERAQREAEEQVRREAEQLAQREAEEQARRNAELRAEQEAQERARLEAAEQARLEAERARIEAEQQARREAEERARQEALLRAQQAAEEQARREAEKRARSEAREQARRDAQAAAEQKAREKAQAKALAREQRAAEKAAARAARQRARLDAEAKAQHEAELRVQHKQAQAAAAEAAAQARADAKARAKAEALAAKSRAAKSEPQAAATIAGVEAYEEALVAQPVFVQHGPEPVLTSVQPAKHYRKPGKWRKPLALALLALAVIAIAGMPLLRFEQRRVQLEQQMSAAFAQPVRIGALHFAWLPRPHWRLDDTTIGAQHEITIGRLSAFTTLGTLWAEQPDIGSVTLDDAQASAAGAGWLLFGNARQQLAPHASVRMHDVRLTATQLALPAIDVTADAGADGAWQSILLDSREGGLHAALQAQRDAWKIDLNADRFVLPFDTGFVLDKFNASGTIDQYGLAFNTFSGMLLGGMVDGNASLKWGAAWSLDGTLKAHRLDAAQLAPQSFAGGKLDGSGRFAMRAASAPQLSGSLRLNGNATVHDGVLLGIDLANALRGAGGGKEAFTQFHGNVGYEHGRLQLRNMRIAAGALSASGSADIDAQRRLNGWLSVDLNTPSRHAHNALALAGTVAQPRLEPRLEQPAADAAGTP